MDLLSTILAPLTDPEGYESAGLAAIAEADCREERISRKLHAFHLLLNQIDNDPEVSAGDGLMPTNTVRGWLRELATDIARNTNHDAQFC